jgi:hypothetical protein
MKKLVLSLLGAATLAVSSNASALNTVPPYQVLIQRGLIGIPVGAAIFEFDSDIPFTPLHPNGFCEYDMEWVNELSLSQPLSGLGLSAECFLLEQKIHGGNSCLVNSTMGVTSFLVNDPHMACSGFDYFQNFDPVVMIQLGEMFGVNSPGAQFHLVGLIQFSTPLLGGSFFGFELRATV